MSDAAARDDPAYDGRILYGTPVTEDLLERVGGCEDVLHRLGFHASGVRHHGDVARIEVGPDDIASIVAGDVRQPIVEAFKALGYRYVALDLEGYRTGSLNEVLPPETKQSGDP